MGMAPRSPRLRTQQSRVALVVTLVTVLITCILLLTIHRPGNSGAVGRWALTKGFLSQKRDGKSTSRSGLRVHEDGMVHNLVYVSDPDAAKRLGCPIDNNLACFYSFQKHSPGIPQPLKGSFITAEDCDIVFEPLPSDHGRGWCLRQGSEPSWLREVIPSAKRFKKVKNPILLTGYLDGPNPTHQANLHFHGIWRWMKSKKLLPGMLHMLVDSRDTKWAPGVYGTGLAESIGKVEWLPLLEPGLHHYSKVQFSIPDAELFPFDLKHLAIDGYVDTDYLELAESVKTRAICELTKGKRWPLPCLASAETTKPRVILSKRKDSESRVWKNVEDLAAELSTDEDLDVRVVTFGTLPFFEQVQMAAEADVLVGITGSDLVNMMFLPLTGSIVEIFPAAEHETVFVPELANMAKMLGKNHFTYVSAGNITFNEAESRLIFRTKTIEVAVTDLAALVRHAVQQTRHGSYLQSFACTYTGLAVECKSK